MGGKGNSLPVLNPPNHGRQKKPNQGRNPASPSKSCNLTENGRKHTHLDSRQQKKNRNDQGTPRITLGKLGLGLPGQLDGENTKRKGGKSGGRVNTHKGSDR